LKQRHVRFEFTFSSNTNATVEGDTQIVLLSLFITNEMDTRARIWLFSFCHTHSGRS